MRALHKSEGYQRDRKKIMLAIDQNTYNRIDEIRPEDVTIQECIRQMVEWGLESGEDIL